MSVVTEILQEPAEKSITQMIAERAERGSQLYLTSRQLIARTGADTYTVPASGDGAYTVRYGADREDCTCTDFGIHRGELACKHLTAVALIYAARRRRRSRPSCFAGAVTLSYEEDGVEHKVAVPCRRCNARFPREEMR
jgi:hypothetical protein